MPDPRPSEEVSRFPLSTWLLILTGLLIFAACTWAAYRQTHRANQGDQGERGKTEGAAPAAAGRQGASRSPRSPRPAWLPDPRLTPGAVFPRVLADDVCKPGYSARMRNVTEAMKRQVFARQGLPWADRAKYEVDHRVPLECGGANELTNLYAMPWAGPHGAREKDRLENEVHRRICSGEMTLREGQAVFLAPDWVPAYTKYVGH